MMFIYVLVLCYEEMLYLALPNWLHFKINSATETYQNEGRARDQAGSRWVPIAAGRVQTRV
jgi:hypothetical protein